ncbi:hypothetical protein, partial [Erwinia amylovora]|uniref:hypothetical protein n=1 Tax=Erwinia amylovora TaxID=552 RepID=UPI0020BEF1E7
VFVSCLFVVMLCWDRFFFILDCFVMSFLYLSFCMVDIDVFLFGFNSVVLTCGYFEKIAKNFFFCSAHA